MLRVRIYDPDNPSIQDTVAVKLRLPSPNRLLLTLEPSMKHFERSVQIAPGDTGVLSPFANTEETWQFALENQWHNERDLLLTLYQCPTDDASIRGKITDKVRQQALESLRLDELAVIGQTSLKVAADEKRIFDWERRIAGKRHTPPGSQRKKRHTQWHGL